MRKKITHRRRKRKPRKGLPYRLGKQSRFIRVWNDTTGTEIAGFVGILLLQWEVKVGDPEKYWTCQSDRMFFPSIQSSMTGIRWQQIKRYLKISNPRNDLDSAGPNWHTQIEPLYRDFLKAWKKRFSRWAVDLIQRLISTYHANRNKSGRGGF